ncbi:MAG: hypothetical protein P8Y48_03695 [Novosphingobium sp.]
MKTKTLLLLATACLLPSPGLAAEGETNAFIQYRPTDRVMIMLNANNLFDVPGLVDADGEFIPSSGVVTARAINPRNISTSLRFNF